MVSRFNKRESHVHKTKPTRQRDLKPISKPSLTPIESKYITIQMAL